MALTSPLIGSRFDECLEAMMGQATIIQEEYPTIHNFLHSVKTTFKAMIQSVSPKVSQQLSPYYHGFVNETCSFRREPSSASEFVSKLIKLIKLL